jgi:hypothetical protein
MNDRNKEQAESGKQGTNKPWERPGQSSQNPQSAPPPRTERTTEDNKTA